MMLPSAEPEFFSPMKDGLAKSVIFEEEEHRMAEFCPRARS